MANPDDEPMWAADCVVATIPATANEFTIECNHLTLVKGNQFDGRIKTDPHKHIHDFLGVCDMFKYRATDNEAVRLMMFPLSLTGEAKTCLTKGNIIKIFSHGLNETTQEALNVIDGGIFLYKTLNQAYQLIKDKVLLKLDWAKNQKPKALVRKTKAFANKGSNNSDTDKIMTRMDVMTMKMDAQYKEISYRMQSLRRLADKQSTRPSGSLLSNTQPNPRGNPPKLYTPPQARNKHVNAVFTRSGRSYDPPTNLNNPQNDSENPINFDSDDENEESTPVPKPQTPEPKEASTSKPYKPRIPYPQLL
ncbi:hypothetical protein Tco_0216206 [Tanacetum coccineum]